MLQRTAAILSGAWISAPRTACAVALGTCAHSVSARIESALIERDGGVVSSIAAISAISGVLGDVVVRGLVIVRDLVVVSGVVVVRDLLVEVVIPPAGQH